MDTHFVEATNGEQNWGKFAVLRFTDDEWKVISQVDGRPLLAGRGWSKEHVLVVDLQTGEGAFFYPAGFHRSDLEKHRIWCCPMYPWALKEILSGDHDPLTTEPLLDFPEAPFEWGGYRRDPLRTAAEAMSDAWSKFIEDDDLEFATAAIELLRQALDQS